MIGIQLSNGHYLQLPTDITLRYEMQMLAFNDDVIEANVVYPFDIPVMGNEEIFEFANIFSVVRNQRRYECVFFVNGQRLFKGLLYVTKINSSYFSCSMIEINDLDTMSTTSIRDIGWDVVDVTPMGKSGLAYYADEVVTKTYPEVLFNFPMIKAPLCYGDENSSNSDFDGYVNNYSNGHFGVNTVNEDPVKDNKYSMAPLLYVVSILKKIADFFGFTIVGNFINNVDIQKLITTSLRLSDKGDIRFFTSLELTYPPAPLYLPMSDKVLYWDNIIEDSDGAYDLYYYKIKGKGYHNVKGKFELTYLRSDADGVCNLELFLGDDRIDYIVDIGEFVSFEMPVETRKVTIDYDFTFFANESDVDKQLYFRAYAQHSIISAYCTCEISNISRSNLNIYDDIIDLSKYVPNITCGEFISFIKKTFCQSIAIDVDRKIIELSSIDTILKADAIDLTHLISIKNCEIELEKENSFEFCWDWGGEDRVEIPTDDYFYYGEITNRSQLPNDYVFGKIITVLNEKNLLRYYSHGNHPRWAILNDVFDDLTFGNGDIKINPIAAPTKMTYDNPKLLPIINDTFFSKLYGSGTDLTNIRLMSYYGMQEDADGNLYPFASSGIHDLQGNKIGNLAIDWNGENGIYETFWRRWAEFRANEEVVTAVGSIDIVDFINIRKLFMPQEGTKKVRKIRLVDINYIPSKVSVLFSNSDTFDTEFTLVKPGKSSAL